MTIIVIRMKTPPTAAATIIIPFFLSSAMFCFELWQTLEQFSYVGLGFGAIFLRWLRLYVLCLDSCLKTYIKRKIKTVRFMSSLS